MKNEQEKTEWMQKPVVVWFGAMLCCFLWGSAFPCIKIGYKLWEINSLDTASQILFAGMRFLLAGILAIVLGSMLERRFLKPEQGAAGKILCCRFCRRSHSICSSISDWHIQAA